MDAPELRRRPPRRPVWAPLVALWACHGLPGIESPSRVQTETVASTDATQSSALGGDAPWRVHLSATGLVAPVTLSINGAPGPELKSPGSATLTIDADNFDIEVTSQPGQICAVDPAKGVTEDAARGAGIKLTCRSAMRFTAGQAAARVVGQADFSSTGAQSPPTPASLNAPWGQGAQLSDGTVLFADKNNRRVVGFAVPVTNSAPAATWFWGTPSDSVSDRSLRAPTGTDAGNGRLAIADSGNHRVLIFAPVPGDETKPPIVAIGQPDLTSNGAACGNQNLNTPTSAIFAGTNLVVVDQNNNRVLIWRQTPSSFPAPPPDVILGQGTGAPDPANCGTPKDIGPNTMLGPQSAFWDGAWLFVADKGFNRVLIWKGMPDTSGKPPDMLLGADNFYDRSGYTAENYRLRGPRSVVADDDTVWVADTGNHRVLAFTKKSILEKNNTDPGGYRRTEAAYVLGQAGYSGDPAGGLPNQGGAPGATTLSKPTGGTLVGLDLWVTDSDNNRIVIYQSN